MEYINERELETRLGLGYLSGNSALGWIVDNKDDRNTVGVYIPKLMNGLDFSKGANEKDISIDMSKIKNSKNTKIGKNKVKVRNYVEIPKMSSGTTGNSMYVRGERCFVEFADQDINSITLRPYGTFESPKRPVDRITSFISATGKEKTPLKNDNTYFFDMDSDKSIIHIHMSNKNGEVSEYDIMIDGKAGSIMMSDGKRNLGILTEDDVISGQNEAGTFFTCKGNTFKAEGDNIEFKANTKLIIETPNMEVKADSLKVEGNSFEEKYSTNTKEGSSLELKYSNQKIEGTVQEHKLNAVKYDTPLFSTSGAVCPQSVSFSVPFGSPPTPVMPKIDEAGMASFSGPASMPLMKQPSWLPVIMELCTKVDALGALLGMPPTCIVNATAASTSGAAISCKG